MYLLSIDKLWTKQNCLSLNYTIIKVKNNNNKTTKYSKLMKAKH